MRIPKIEYRVGVSAVASAIALVILAGCGGSSGTSAGDSDGPPQKGGTLVTRVAFTSASLDPGTVTGYSQTIGTRALVDTLVLQVDGDQEFSPWLATSWKVNDDATRYEFTLRDGVTFSNGEVLDAEAVRLSFQRILDDADYYSGAVTWLDGLDKITAVDEKTIRFDFTRPNSAFLQATSQPTLGIVAPKFSALSFDDRQVGTAIVGSGPFVAVENRNEEGYVLERRDDYDWGPEAADHQGPAYLDRIEQIYVSDNSLAVSQLLSGEIDLLHNTNAKDKDLIAASEDKVTYFKDPVPSTPNGISFNTKNGPTAELKVRQAVQLATDTKALLGLASSIDQAATNPALSSSNPYASDQSDLLVHDPARAKRLLDEAGWVPGDDGIRVKNGERLTLDLFYRPTGQPHEPQYAAQQIQLKKVGIELRVANLTPAEANQRIQNGNWAISFGAPGTSGVRPDSDILRSGYGGQSDELDQVFKKIQATTEFEAKKKLVAQATQLIYEQGLFLPYYDFIAPIVYRNEVHLQTIDATHVPWVGDIWKE